MLSALDLASETMQSVSYQMLHLKNQTFVGNGWFLNYTKANFWEVIAKTFIIFTVE
jgi:hypothetical protein